LPAISYRPRPRFYRGRYRSDETGDCPGGPVAKTPRFQCRGPGFDPCSRNEIPHVRTKGAAMKIEDLSS